MKKLAFIALALMFWGCAEEKFPKATVAFYPTTKAILNEGGNPLTISLQLSSVIQAESQIVLSFSSVENIQTTPAVDPFGKLVIPVQVGAKSISFTITPQDDQIEQGTKVIRIQIESYSGDIRSKANDLFLLTLVDNEGPRSIADTRTLFPASLPATSRVNIDQQDYIIRGVITSDRSTANINSRAAHLQDATAAIGLFFDAACPYDLGDSIEIRGGDGAYLGKFSQFLQYNIKTTQTKLIQKGVEVKPRTISGGDLVSNRYEAELVKIEGCIFPNPGVGTYHAGSGSGTSVNIISSTGNFVLRTTSTATFGSQILPSGIHTLVGLSGRFNESGQLILRDPAKDVIKQ
jgi:hypothetical protein